MSVILTLNKSGWGGATNRRGRGCKKTERFSVLNSEKKEKYKNSRTRSSVDFFPKKIFLVALSLAVILCLLYLYQVNDLATKGYEIRDAENQLAQLREINAKNKIKEMELRSIKSVEKTKDGQNFVVSNGVSYIEINGPVAMK